MPEGDTIAKAAAALRRALAGKGILRFETQVGQVAAVDARMPVAGRVVHGVEARGKHLLMVFRRAGGGPPAGEAAVGAPDPLGLGLLASDLVLHTHMRMIGSWHIYRPGEAWRKPARLARVTLHTAGFVAPCFNAPVVELLDAREVARHAGLRALGPDAMAPGFDAAQARARLAAHPEREIGVALLDQRAMAGLGNVFKSEVLFLRRLSPFARVGDLPLSALDALIAEARRLLRLNAQGGARRTLFGLNPNERLWVYGRSGQPCRMCGQRIAMRRQGPDARSTYFCPTCQAVPTLTCTNA